MKVKISRLGAVLASAAIVIYTSSACAVGPAQMATMDRSIYPGQVSSPADFDRASRLEILSYTQVLAGLAGDEPSPAASASVVLWRDRMITLLFNNFSQAVQTCNKEAELFCKEKPSSKDAFVALARRFNQDLPPSLGTWYVASHQFYVSYGEEQRRLAAYFPRISSEIDTYSEREITGRDLSDKTFQLSFDDGPTAVGGTTDELIAFLKDRQLHAFFFMLGDQLNARHAVSTNESLRNIYAGQCPASHGRIHNSHQKMPDWKSSINYTHDLLNTVFPDVKSIGLFRPPYGQRVRETETFVESLGGRIALWNIDSQDWSGKIHSNQVSDRVLSLMLVWRRGIILFHDIHPKAREALPAILDATKGSGLHWQNCSDFF